MILQPTKFCVRKKKVFGSDIETHNNNLDFTCATIVGEDYFKTVFSKKEAINEFKRSMFRDSLIIASNLGFDFWGTFRKEPEEKFFNFCERGSNLILSKAYLRNNKFVMKSKPKKPLEERSREEKLKVKNTHFIQFLDTMNFAPYSVAKWGEILKLSKIKKPKFLGKEPKNNSEWLELTKYNRRDSEISRLAFLFLKKAFNSLGTEIKITVASTSMKCFTNNYLDRKLFRHSIPSLQKQLKAYYGGNVHAYARGRIKDYFYYDFNSLYPSVMVNEFPDPNTLRHSFMGRYSYIEDYEGVSDVTIYCPLMDYPLLPFRTDAKLLFPIGVFRAWYSHIELRRAKELGYIIGKIHETIYFKKTFYPFKEFVETLYKKRLEYQKSNDPMELVVKLLLNSLYGKFAQKFTNRDEFIHMSKVDLKLIHSLDDFEIVDNYLRVKKDLEEPKRFCIPIFSIYTTAYGRIKLHDALIKTSAVYCDTDSLWCKKELVSSDKLGKLKLEHYIDDGIIVKPKWYMINYKHIKTKGLGRKITAKMFNDLLLSPEIEYNKFLKFRESIRRKLTVNQIIPIIKHFDFEDNKRFWEEPFNPEVKQLSMPHIVEKNILCKNPKPKYKLYSRPPIMESFKYQ